MAFEIHKDDVIPIYYQLATQIREKIENGEYKPGDKLPSETALCDQFAISRMTVKQAMDSLVNEGVVYRKKGSGSFVADAKFEQPLSKLTSFSEDMEARGMRPGSQTLCCEVIVAPEHVREIFGFSESDKVIHLVRMRLANDRPMALEHCYLKYDLCFAVAECDLNNRSLYKVLEEKCGIRMVRATQQIAFSTCTAEEAQLLQVQANMPAFHLARRTYDQHNRLVEYTDSKYRSDRYYFTIEMS